MLTFVYHMDSDSIHSDYDSYRRLRSFMAGQNPTASSKKKKGGVLIVYMEGDEF